jgi:hypothetical protein
LRMIPQQADFPWNVQWPPEPTPNWLQMCTLT